jgi:hypothetical protein
MPEVCFSSTIQFAEIVVAELLCDFDTSHPCKQDVLDIDLLKNITKTPWLLIYDSVSGNQEFVGLD